MKNHAELIREYDQMFGNLDLDNWAVLYIRNYLQIKA
jgi:hypothetical protein